MNPRRESFFSPTFSNKTATMKETEMGTKPVEQRDGVRLQRSDGPTDKYTSERLLINFLQNH